MSYPREATDGGPAGRDRRRHPDQLATEPGLPLHLPMPNSPRLRRAVSELAADPARSGGLAAAARRAAVSERTFERQFRFETGISYRAWRQQAQLMKAVEWLSLGASVGDVAERLGYDEAEPFRRGLPQGFGRHAGTLFRRKPPGRGAVAPRPVSLVRLLSPVRLARIVAHGSELMRQAASAPDMRDGSIRRGRRPVRHRDPARSRCCALRISTSTRKKSDRQTVRG